MSFLDAFFEKLACQELLANCEFPMAYSFENVASVGIGLFFIVEGFWRMIKGKGDVLTIVRMIIGVLMASIHSLKFFYST